MKYGHTVKYNGVYYSAGQEVPEQAGEKETPLPFSVESDSTAYEETNTKQYSRSEISLMKKADLQKLASENGVENAYDKTGDELKKILYQIFNL